MCFAFHAIKALNGFRGLVGLLHSTTCGRPPALWAHQAAMADLSRLIRLIKDTPDHWRQFILWFPSRQPSVLFSLTWRLQETAVGWTSPHFSLRGISATWSWCAKAASFPFIRPSSVPNRAYLTLNVRVVLRWNLPSPAVKVWVDWPDHYLGIQIECYQDRGIWCGHGSENARVFVFWGLFCLRTRWFEQSWCWKNRGGKFRG